jgi:cytochrome c2
MRAFSLIGVNRQPGTVDTPRIKGVPQRFVRLIIASLSIGLTGCHEDRTTVAFGDAKRGIALIERNGCGTCHIIPGVEGADGLVGPPLTMMARRIYIAGVARNTPQNMTVWLQNPQAVVPGNAMPNMNLTQQDARDVTAYLYTLR